MNRRFLKPFVGVVVVAAFAALALLPTTPLPGEPWTALLLGALAALTASRRIRLPGLGTKITAADSFTLVALAVLGPAPAMLAALGGVIGAAVGNRRWPRPYHFALNTAAAIVSICSASWIFLSLGAEPGGRLIDLMWPLTAAAVAYFLINTSLIAVAIAMERGTGWLRAWRRSCGWATLPYFASLTVAALLVLVLRHLGPWGLALGVAPSWLLLAYVGVYKDRLREQRRRTVEVERLNRQLGRTVTELQQALDHVRCLQGLLPICMHCKRIRDDQDSWHQLETYIAQHSEATFTHSLCGDCRAEHYPPEQVRRRKPA